MTDLERARAHLLGRQADLAEARIWKATHSPGLGMTAYENNFLAALSWVWEEQVKVCGCVHCDGCCYDFQDDE